MNYKALKKEGRALFFITHTSIDDFLAKFVSQIYSIIESLGHIFWQKIDPIFKCLDCKQELKSQL